MSEICEMVTRKHAGVYPVDKGFKDYPCGRDAVEFYRRMWLCKIHYEQYKRHIDNSQIVRERDDD